MNYCNITDCDQLNGPGLRVVLWVAGCAHACPGCQNQQTWNPASGIEFTDEAKHELFDKLSKDYISGITFSGGDPLFVGNRDTITKLAKEIRETFPNKTIWLYTGYVYEQVEDLEIMKYLDVLVDGPFVMEKANINTHWTGSDNQRVINIPETRERKNVVLMNV